MTGLEKMQSQILDEARRSADEILEQAEKEAGEIREEAGKSAQAESSRILEKSRAEVKNIQERTLSSCALQRRQILLEAKQEIIARILENAYHTLIEADEDTYFRIIRKMLEKYTAGQAGEICFSERDLGRMPEGFEKEIQEIAGKNGGTLVLSKEPRKISGGFVLVYGGIEDELSDEVHKILFS